MAMGRKARERQGEFWIETQLLPGTPRHVFYERLDGILAAGDFDRFVEDLCAPYYAEALGRESIPPGVYFRMMLIGYFEGIDSQRGIAWRCADSRSLAAFEVSPPRARRRVNRRSKRLFSTGCCPPIHRMSRIFPTGAFDEANRRNAAADRVYRRLRRLPRGRDEPDSLVVVAAAGRRFVRYEIASSHEGMLR